MVLLFRYLQSNIQADLKRKMVFLGGPRQVGKTTFATALLGKDKEKSEAYFNWDVTSSRKKIMAEELPFDAPLIVLDEIHKYSRWHNLVKGFFDKYKNSTAFLVTGSARLNQYRRGGDSLVGRYHYYTLHPLSLGELKRFEDETLQKLLKFGGFPEPFFTENEVQWRRWQRDRDELLIREDIRDLERVRELTHIGLLLDTLPDRVGSPLSVESLRKNLEVSHDSVKRWLDIFENLYITYRISPFGSPKIRAVKKEQKLYFWDWSKVPSPGEKFENLVASQLLKYCDFLQDTEGHRMELRFLRDTDKREVDFVVIKDKKPIFAVECKTGEKQISPHIRYFKERTNIQKFYQVHLGTNDYEKDGVRVCPFVTFCKEVMVVV